MTKDRLHFLLLNIGHFLDHLFMLVFATVAALALHRDWGVGYAELLVYATPGFLAFGLFALPAGWLADRWSRDGMMCIFFIGIGCASILTSLANSPLQIGVGLFLIGVFAAIYHPVGLAIVTMKWRDTGMRIAANGVWGNFGVAIAALLTGYMVDNSGWRSAFVLPGMFSIAVGVAYYYLCKSEIRLESVTARSTTKGLQGQSASVPQSLIIRVSTIVFVTAAFSSLIFQSTTFALPKIFDERLQGLAEMLSNRGLQLVAVEQGGTATMIGVLAFFVFATASIAQLVVGKLLDRHGPRRVFLVLAMIQILFFAAMPGLTDSAALFVALGFMLGAFGQIPINDFMIGKMASGASRARVYAVRYVVSFTVLAASLPFIGFVHSNWGFDTLFLILSAAAAVLFLAVMMLPRQLPSLEPQPVLAE